MSGGLSADPDLGAVDDAGPPAGAEVVDDLGQGPQPHPGTDGAAALGDQRPVQMTLALNMNNVVTELYAVLLFSDLADTSDKPVAIERDVPVTLGKQGHPPP
ncbi:hypothetical protein [Streptomyces sp. NPDC029554]|uniref:hypothetical protein n=1 Tax=Streptomyces sp. NPDC029554 TaxID=3155126 RepID=UPI0033D9AB8B